MTSMSFRPFALPTTASSSQVMLTTSSSSPSSSGGSPVPPGGVGSPGVIAGGGGGPGAHHKACREAGRPLLTDPTTGHTLCSCELPGPGLLGYPRLPPSLLGLADPGVYSTAAAYAAQAQAGYLGLPTDPATAALYSSMGPPFELKESPDGLRTLTQASPFFYDPSLAYPYSYNGLELSSAARRKNATRENTNTLKAWLYEHRKNPYPTKGEKIMLAIITKMTLTQVSTWFANARRRLKKENKMTWSPRSGGRDDDDDDDDHDDAASANDKTEKRDSKDLGSTGEDDDKDDDDDDDDEEDIVIDEGFDEQTCLASSRLQASLAEEALRRAGGCTPAGDGVVTETVTPGDAVRSKDDDDDAGSRHSPSRTPSPGRVSPPGRDRTSPPGHHSPSNSTRETVVIASKCSTTEQVPSSRPKPRIWSLADVATSASPPVGGRRSPGRPGVRSPWAVTATYALTHPTHQTIGHPYFMLPGDPRLSRSPLHPHMPYTMAHHPPHPSLHHHHQQQPPKSSPHHNGSGRLSEEDTISPLRSHPQCSPQRNHLELQNTSQRSHIEHRSSPHRTPLAVETAFKPVPKRIPTL